MGELIHDVDKAQVGAEAEEKYRKKDIFTRAKRLLSYVGYQEISPGGTSYKEYHDHNANITGEKAMDAHERELAKAREEIAAEYPDNVIPFERKK